MTNILIITGWLDVSGTETFIMNVLRNIDKSLYHIDFLLFQKKNQDIVLKQNLWDADCFICHQEKKVSLII